MIKAIIIDDERLIREGLVTYIDWESLGIKVCGCAGDCAGGVKKAIEQHPQLILADICLPDASGLEMFRQIKDCGLRCQVIFISSYSEFQYAQEAIKLGAFDYLLKPIEADALYDCVRRCAEKIGRAKENQEPVCDRDRAARVLLDVLTNALQTDQTFFLAARQMGMPEMSHPFLGVSLSGDFSFMEKGEEENIPILEFLKISVSANVTCCCFFTVPEMEEKLFRKISGVLEESLFEAVCFCQGTLSLSGHLQQMLCSLLLKQSGDREIRPLFLPEKQSLAPEVMKSLRAEDLKTAACQFLKFCQDQRWTVSYLDFQFECYKFLENIYKQLTWVYASPIPAGFDIHDFLEQLKKPNNLYDLFLIFCQILETVFAKVRRDWGQSPYTRKVLAIIQSRYGESLSLKIVARELHVSSSYLSSVFKADTGRPFSDYLFWYRMNIACDLVRQGNLRIYEIGEKVGYPDVAQFSKCFKKHFGYSPKQLQGGVKTMKKPVEI